ncbi:uncharacterized protein MONBRDRAFT_29131 [Monosiga brevicollis MX1]|uniref:G/T mismatch-specific thymine DNA glycosylase n=1 Tax=Monosiga brevicollis TaxID=81824 RepID=A9VA78_MONBE|nr:uncharacterized protein MONBRDRAFT_29131 [Monosiga brevicollis MX1]EDQ85618.1 predicted protein [Monosiga brevicollis MX1]|eukprot:XP_001749567.1 hypothetical protein [Monosiga brevicollis MX1]
MAQRSRPRQTRANQTAMDPNVKRKQPPPKRVKRERIIEGTPESEALRGGLPDLLLPNLRVLIIGINPGVWSAARGHHYAAGVELGWQTDMSCGQYGIGFTNSVARTTRGQMDLDKSEIEDGVARLRQLIQEYQPAIAAFNGKGVSEIFFKRQFSRKVTTLGLQQETIGETRLYIMPSTSPRGATRPRWQDKLPFFRELAALAKPAIKADEGDSVALPAQPTTVTVKAEPTEASEPAKPK